MKTLYEQANYYLKEDTVYWLKMLDKVSQKKTGEPYPNRDATEEELQQATLNVGKELGYQQTEASLANNARSAYQVISKNLPNIKPDEKKVPETTPEDSSKDSEKVPKDEQTFQDIPPKTWPKYEEFRKKWYKQTVDLGWPKDIANPDYKDSEKDGGIVYPWGSNKSAFVFNKRGKGLTSFRNYTQKIKSYLYNKFERDQKGLETLARKVDSILDVESQYLKRKKVGSIMGSLLMNIFRGIGGTTADENILKWLGSKIQGMTIFEYQKYILDELVTKMAVSDDSATVLKNILYPLHKIVKDKCSDFYDVSKVELEYDNYDKSYEAFFKVKVRPGTKDEVHGKSYSPYVYILDNIVIPIIDGKLITSKSGRNLRSSVTSDEVRKLIQTLKGSTEKTVSKALENSDDVIFTYDALDPENKGKVIGTYQIEFKFGMKSCEIRVSFIPKKVS